MNLYESIKNNLKESEDNKLNEIISLLSWDAPQYRGAPDIPEKPFGINEKNFADAMRAKNIDYGVNSAGDGIEIQLTTQELFDNADIDTFVREVKRVMTNILNELKISEVNVYLEIHTRGEQNYKTEEFIVKATDGDVVLAKAEKDNESMEESNIDTYEMDTAEEKFLYDVLIKDNDFILKYGEYKDKVTKSFEDYVKETVGYLFNSEADPYLDKKYLDYQWLEDKTTGKIYNLELFYDEFCSYLSEDSESIEKGE